MTRLTRLNNVKKKHKQLVDALSRSGSGRPVEVDSQWFQKMEWIVGRDPAASV